MHKSAYLCIFLCVCMPVFCYVFECCGIKEEGDNETGRVCVCTWCGLSSGFSVRACLHIEKQFVCLSTETYFFAVDNSCR